MRLFTCDIWSIIEIPKTYSIPFPETHAACFCSQPCTAHTACVSYSWPGQAQWGCQALQLHSQELLSKLTRGAEADQRGLLPTLPPCAALRRQLWLWHCQLEVLQVRFRENGEKVSRGMSCSNNVLHMKCVFQDVKHKTETCFKI